MPEARNDASKTIKCLNCKVDKPQTDENYEWSDLYGYRHVCNECKKLRDIVNTQYEQNAEKYKRSHRAGPWAKSSSPVAIDTERRCPNCGIVKPLTSQFFYKGNSQGFQGYCKDCSKEKQKEYYNTIGRWKS